MTETSGYVLINNDRLVYHAHKAIATNWIKPSNGCVSFTGYKTMKGAIALAKKLADSHTNWQEYANIQVVPAKWDEYFLTELDGLTL
jgi:hypothetical protein